MSDLGDFSDYDTDDSASAPDDAPDDATATSEETDDFDRVDLAETGRDRGIGTLAVSEGLRIDEDANETALRAYVTAGNRSAIRLGTYLLAPYPGDETLFCRISGLEYAQEFRSDDATEIHARRAMRSSSIDEQDYKFLADLQPLAVLYADDEELRRRQGGP